MMRLYQISGHDAKRDERFFIKGHQIMGKSFGVGAIVVLLGVMFINALVDSIGYLTDIIGEIVLVCAIPVAVLGGIFMAYRILIGYQVGRIDSIERNLYNERLAIENEAMRKRMELVSPVGNVLPVAYDSIVSGQITGDSLRLLESNIDAGRTHPNVPNSIHYSVKNDNNISEGNATQAAISAAPTEVSKSMLNRHEVLIGFQNDQPLYVAPHKLKSMVCGGISGSGKSNTTRLLLMQYALMGWQLAIFDPHGNSEEGILPSLMPLSDSFFMDPAIEFDEGLNMLRCIVAEGERRKAFEGSRPEDFPPLMYVIDEVAEFANLCTDDERAYAQKHLPVILNSYRKFNIYAMCISQFWSKSYMGDLGFILRRSAQTSLVHRMDHDSTKVIERTADGDMVDAFTVGECLLNNTGIKHAKLQVPLCDMKHIEAIVPTSGSSSGSSSTLQIEQSEIDTIEVLQKTDIGTIEVLPEVGTEVPDEHRICLEAASILEKWQRIEIERRLQDGQGSGQIILDVFNHKGKTGGYKGQQYARMINGVRLEMGMDLPYSPARANKS